MKTLRPLWGRKGQKHWCIMHHICYRCILGKLFTFWGSRSGSGRAGGCHETTQPVWSAAARCHSNIYSAISPNNPYTKHINTLTSLNLTEAVSPTSCFRTSSSCGPLAPAVSLVWFWQETSRVKCEQKWTEMWPQQAGGRAGMSR